MLVTNTNQKPQSLSFGKACIILLVLLVVIVGGGFISRAYTVRHLPLEQIDRIDVITITKEDLTAATQLLPSVLQEPAIASRLKSFENGEGHRLLAYFIPIDYMEQGVLGSFIGMLALVLINFGRASPVDIPRILMAAAAFFAIYKKIGLPYILLVGGDCFHLTKDYRVI